MERLSFSWASAIKPPGSICKHGDKRLACQPFAPATAQFGVQREFPQRLSAIFGRRGLAAGAVACYPVPVSPGGSWSRKRPSFLSEALLAAFDTNDRINHYLIENLPAEAWRASLLLAKAATLLPSSRTCTTSAACG